MKKFTFITISISLLFAFAACSDSSHVLSPSSKQSLDAGGQDGALSKPAERTLSVHLRPTGSAIPWRLQAELTSNSNGQFSGSGKFEIILKGGVVFIPILGVMQIEKNASGGFDIRLQMQGQKPGSGQVQLRFRGNGLWNSETGTMSGSGNVSGIFSNIPELRIGLNGPAQIIIPDTAI